MTTTAHTPGPWYVDKVDDRCAFNVFPHGGTSALVQVAGPDGAHPYALAAQANARLIASAPQLLTTLQRLLGAIDRLPGNNPLDGLADEARAAIAKATGGAA